ncbi:hypothetical protein L1785_10095 [Antribacter sp. KLBMP9083]|uniref:VWFA domain-containing protein n=1 Tax=Antribacter soli TaxID=2910976 RepID=A0AA41U6S1_9MICO|nr:hypothetical protein [Antribacter soli]MCF4121333.1 hypothetical protein [Antribacter soli]
MGGGSWSRDTYDAVTGARAASGATFGYDRAARRSGKYEAHPDLDPTRLGRDGRNLRESRDSAEHAASLPIVVGFDSTGSMGSVPRVVQQKLATLFGLLVDKGYATDPQVAVATYGDATCDRVPLQVSQFESDNRIDENLDRLLLEGGGGGNDGETSNLLLYYLAHHTVTDAWEKRGRKGYVFLIADEKQIPITAEHVRRFVGDPQPLGGLDVATIAADVSRTWNVRVLLINNAAALQQRSQEFYEGLFGPDSLTIVQDPTAIAETIAAIVGFEEGKDLATITDDLTVAAGREVALRVGKSLAARRPAVGLR